MLIDQTNQSLGLIKTLVTLSAYLYTAPLGSTTLPDCHGFVTRPHYTLCGNVYAQGGYRYCLITKLLES